MSERLQHALAMCNKAFDPSDEAIWNAPGFAGYVYAVQGASYVKIGVARNVEKRLSAMQSGCPYELTVLAAFPSGDPYKLEAHLHHKWRRFRLRGEWFVPTQDAIDELLEYDVSNSPD